MSDKLPIVWIVFSGLSPGWVYCDEEEADREVARWEPQRRSEQYIPAARIRELVGFVDECMARCASSSGMIVLELIRQRLESLIGEKELGE